MLIVPKENWQRVANIVEVSWNKISGYWYPNELTFRKRLGILTTNTKTTACCTLHRSQGRDALTTATHTPISLKFNFNAVARTEYKWWNYLSGPLPILFLFKNLFTIESNSFGFVFMCQPLTALLCLRTS